MSLLSVLLRKGPVGKPVQLDLQGAFPIYPPGNDALQAVGSPLADWLTCRYKQLLN